MRKTSLILAIALAGCTRPAAPSGADFARLVAGRTAGPPQSCVTSRSDQSMRAVDQMTIAYGSGSTIYVNRLPGFCPGLREFSTIIIVTSAGQYCRGDRIRANEPGSIIPGASCNLGDWVPYRRS